MRTLALVTCAAALAACSHAQNPEKSDPLAEQVNGPLQSTDPAFLNDDSATRIACKSDANCPAGTYCHPQRNACFTSYPEPDHVKVDVNCPLVPLYFAVDSAALVPDATKWIDYDAQCMKARGVRRVTVAGFADGRGNQAHNVELSRERAGVVQKALEARGIDKVRVRPEGATGFVLTGTSEHDYAYNRRVELWAK